jgi:hypothetical protein
MAHRALRRAIAFAVTPVQWAAFASATFRSPETALRAWLAGPRTWRGRTALHSQPGVFAGDASRYPAGLNSGATTICPRDVVLNRISFTGW